MLLSDALYASSPFPPNALFQGTTCFGIDPYSFFARDENIASRYRATVLCSVAVGCSGSLLTYRFAEYSSPYDRALVQNHQHIKEPLLAQMNLL